jgi:hypothetical protein
MIRPITVSSLLIFALFFLALWTHAAPPGVKELPPVDQLPAIRQLPDPFLFNDGSRVATGDDWARRREEIKAQVLYYEYGHMPPAPGNVKAAELSSTVNKELGVTEKVLLLTMGPDNKISTHLKLSIPQGKGPFPVVITGDLEWQYVNPPVALIARRGYMLAEFKRTEIVPDSKEHTGAYLVYPEYDWGAASAWAWGFHRVVDYVLTRDDVDPARIAVTGHSRGGKCALLAGATDQRIALTAPNNSGCGGAGCYRFQADKSEDITAILKNFTFWFQPNFKDFIGRIDRLPIDQHSVKALVAPRALLSTEALGDLWANPEGSQQTYLAARHVYDFLGAADKIGIAFREGKHEQNEQDWLVLLDFADKVFSGRHTERRFDELAFPNSQKQFFWTAPSSGK